MWTDETSLHNKCKNTENEETKIPIFLSCHRDEDKNKGAADESKFQWYRHSLWTKPRYVMHLW